MKGSVDLWFAAATDGPRGLSDADLAALAARLGIAMIPGGTVREAMEAAARAARPGDRVVVFGSFHTVGPALSCV
jgi:dihydrofolate synthase/folylpolyglutamate synthase